MQELSKLIDELGNKIEQHEKINTIVSSVTVGWHIAHSTLVIKQIVEQLEKSDTTAYKWKFNIPRFVVFLSNKIPRGKGKAPKSVQVNDSVSKESLKRYIATAKESANSLKDMSAKKHFKHPYFGTLNVKSTFKFLQIHTSHHIQIIEDVINTLK